MKKRTQLFFVMCVMLLITGWRYKLVSERNVWLRMGDDGHLYMQLQSHQFNEQLTAWIDDQSDGDSRFFFFLLL